MHLELSFIQGESYGSALTNSAVWRAPFAKETAFSLTHVFDFFVKNQEAAVSLYVNPQLFHR